MVEATIPDEALANIPPWVRSAAARITPVAGRAGQLIEERVLAEIEASLRADAENKTKRDELPPGELPASRSVADEIAKSRALRDEGALTEEQYAKALDRAIGDTG